MPVHDDAGAQTYVVRVERGHLDVMYLRSEHDGDFQFHRSKRRALLLSDLQEAARLAERIRREFRYIATEEIAKFAKQEGKAKVALR
jgi:hypothetical protein